MRMIGVLLYAGGFLLWAYLGLWVTWVSGVLAGMMLNLIHRGWEAMWSWAF